MGLCVLGAAAALVSNPILLQLGVITGKKRRRRSVEGEDLPNLSPEQAQAVKQKLDEIALLEKFMAQVSGHTHPYIHYRVSMFSHFSVPKVS